MHSFFTRLMRAPRARGPLQAPPAQGQAQFNAYLNPNAFGSEDLDNIVQAIQAADPQARGRGIMGRGRPSPAPTSSVSPSRGHNVTSAITPETASIVSINESLHSAGRVSGSESSWDIASPANLLVEESARSDSVASPGSQESYHFHQWDLFQNTGVAVALAAAAYDSDTSTLVGTESTLADSLYASSMYDGDVPEIDLGSSAASLDSSNRSVQSPRGESSDSQASAHGAGQASLMINTSVLSSSSFPPAPSVEDDFEIVADEEPRFRGDIDQQPIIISVTERNGDRRSAFPPTPTVEDEFEYVVDEEPRFRGDIDQQPIILPVTERNSQYHSTFPPTPAVGNGFEAVVDQEPLFRGHIDQQPMEVPVVEQTQHRHSYFFQSESHSQSSNSSYHSGSSV